MGIWRRDQPLLYNFTFSWQLMQSKVLRECRRNRFGIVERQVKTKEEKTCLFCEKCWCCCPPSTPLCWQEHPVFALRGIHAANFSPCASGGASSSPQLQTCNRLRQQWFSMSQATSPNVSTCPKLDQPELWIWRVPFELLGEKSFFSIFLWISR